jgi:hypothetical protein
VVRIALPVEARLPVNGIENPILIGSAAAAGVAADGSTSPANNSARDANENADGAEAIVADLLG